MTSMSHPVGSYVLSYILRSVGHGHGLLATMVDNENTGIGTFPDVELREAGHLASYSINSSDAE